MGSLISLNISQILLNFAEWRYNMNTIHTCKSIHRKWTDLSILNG